MIRLGSLELAYWKGVAGLAQHIISEMPRELIRLRLRDQESG
jgi:hypothetical protein